jgi:hypothetical protein
VSALLSRLDARRSILTAHLEMLLEEHARSGELDDVQLDLVHSEITFLRDLYDLVQLTEIGQRVMSA